jgi:hypothetical protein
MYRNMMLRTPPLTNFVDTLMHDFRMAQIPQDGTIIEQTKMVTEKFKVEYQESGEIRLIPITEEDNDK